uniref:Uncharacterized protein n=1 Tax=Romanomermis culicivorax TaxID=13658 RepID=A0A915I4Y5_ROMCU
MIAVISLDQLFQEHLRAWWIAEVVLGVAVEKRRICWAAVPCFVGGDPWKAYSGGSHLVIGPCYGQGQNGN